MQGRFNIFQRTMLQWNEWHPYNAVHVLRIPHALDLKRLTVAVETTLQTRGLTGLTIDEQRGTYEYEGGPVICNIATLPGVEDSFLSSEIERQLNTPFVVKGRFTPFRFFVAPDSAAFSLGLAYFHAIADAEAVVRLAKGIVEAYLGTNSPGSSGHLNLYPNRRGGWMQYPIPLALRLTSLPGFFQGIRKWSRPPYDGSQELHDFFKSFSLPPESLETLHRAAKAWGVTLNDLFLAVLLESLVPLASSLAQNSRRRKISLGCIVNIRRDLDSDNPDAFGLFLGSFVVSHEISKESSLKRVASDIHRQTAQVKRQKLYLGTPLQLCCSRLILRFFSTERKKKFYHKHYPLWGGITNMNLNSLWDQCASRQPIDYLRAVSTGPVTPLVLSVTTVADRVNIGLTFRSTVFGAGHIARIQERLIKNLQQLDNG